jgi:hypothetical protein
LFGNPEKDVKVESEIEKLMSIIANTEELRVSELGRLIFSE